MGLNKRNGSDKIWEMQSVFTGPVYVVGDNIDTDQIISAQYLNLVPTIPEEYEKLGSYALAGLPESLYKTRFVKEGQLDSEYPIVVAGKNFGCGSSREHAPIALGSAACRIVLAESFARIFFRNAVATRSEEHTSELQSLAYLVCRLLLEKKKNTEGGTTTSVRPGVV